VTFLCICIFWTQLIHLYFSSFHLSSFLMVVLSCIQSTSTFWYTIEFNLSIFYWGFLHLCPLKRLTCNPLLCFLLFQFGEECNPGFIEFVSVPSLCIPWNNLKNVFISSSVKVWRNSAEDLSGLGLFFFGRIYCCFSFIAYYRLV
jgi:hypothetical protein